MRVRGGTAFVWALTQEGRMAVMVHRMKVLDRLTAANMLGDNIRRVNRIDCPRFEPGVVSGIVARSKRMRQTIPL